MALLGRRAWWLPRRLGRLVPNLDIEGEGLARGLDRTARA
jgi:RND superfamily putative drug exporter